jgi:hypothetical protein
MQEWHEEAPFIDKLNCAEELSIIPQGLCSGKS